MRWLTGCSEGAVRAALRAVAPELGECSIEVEPGGQGDPQWWSSTALIGGQFIAKFAWSRPAASHLANEIAVLTALAGEPAVPFLPEIVASGTDPLLLVTRLVPGASLFDVVDSIDRDRAGRQLAWFLAALHSPCARERTEAAVGPLAGARLPPATTKVLRERIEPWIGPGQHRTVLTWCDWADVTLARPGPTVLAHGDLHGDNQVWDGGELRLVVDFATAGAAEPEYELRDFPGTGPALELMTATLRHYRHFTGRELAVDRVMAWHLRQALYDVMWRSESGLPMADGRTPSDWIDDLAARLRALGISP